MGWYGAYGPHMWAHGGGPLCLLWIGLILVGVFLLLRGLRDGDLPPWRSRRRGPYRGRRRRGGRNRGRARDGWERSRGEHPRTTAGGPEPAVEDGSQA